MLGYPRMFSSAGCFGTLGISSTERTKANQLAVDLGTWSRHALLGAFGFTYKGARLVLDARGLLVEPVAERLNLFNTGELPPNRNGQQPGVRAACARRDPVDPSDEVSSDLDQMLRRVLAAFNDHDLDAIMSHFAEDCVFEDSARTRPVGPPLRRQGRGRRGWRRSSTASRTSTGDDDHFACGNRGVSEWTINGTTVDGERIDVRGCDIWTFDDDGRSCARTASGRSASRDEFDPSRGLNVETARRRPRWASWS